jgi:hypothetical protein
VKLNADLVNIIDDPFPYKIVLGEVGSGRSTVASMILARQIHAGLIRPEDVVVIASSPDATEYVKISIQHALNAYGLTSVHLASVTRLDGKVDAIRIIDEESLLSFIIENVTAILKTTPEIQATAPLLLTSATLPILAVVQCVRKVTQRFMDVLSYFHVL